MLEPSERPSVALRSLTQTKALGASAGAITPATPERIAALLAENGSQIFCQSLETASTDPALSILVDDLPGC